MLRALLYVIAAFLLRKIGFGLLILVGMLMPGALLLAFFGLGALADPIFSSHRAVNGH